MLKSYRWARRLALGVAALPILQGIGGCDPLGTAINIAAGTSVIVVNSLAQTLVQSTIRTLLGTFPQSDILRALFGNSGFFPGIV